MKMQDDTSIVKYVIDLASNRMKDLGMIDDSLDWLSLDSLASALKDVCFESGIDGAREQRCYNVILLMTSETESLRTWFEKISRLPVYFKLVDKMHKGTKKSIKSKLEAGEKIVPPRLMHLMNNSHNDYPEPSRLSSTSPRTLAEGHELSLLLNSGRHVKKKPYSPTVKRDASERRKIQFQDASHIASYSIFDEPISNIEDELNTTRRMMDEITMKRSSPLRNVSNYYKAFDPASSSAAASQTTEMPSTPAKKETAIGTDDFDVSMILSSPAPPPPPALSASALFSSPNFALPPEYRITASTQVGGGDEHHVLSTPAAPLSPVHSTSIETATRVLLDSADVSVSNLTEMFRSSRALRKYRSTDPVNVSQTDKSPLSAVKAVDDERVGRPRALDSHSEPRRSRSEEPMKASLVTNSSPGGPVHSHSVNLSRSLNIHDLNLSPVHAPSGTRKNLSARFPFDGHDNDSSPSPKLASGLRERDPYAYTSSGGGGGSRRTRGSSRPGLMDDHAAEYDTHSSVPMRDTLYQVAGVVMNLDNMHLSHSMFSHMDGSQFSEAVGSSMKLLLIFQKWLFAHSASTAVAQAASAVASQKSRLQALIGQNSSNPDTSSVGGPSSNNIYVRSVAVMFYRHMMALPDFVTELFGLEQWLREKMKLLIVLAAKCFIFRHWALHSGVTAAARLYYDKSRLRFGFERFLEYSMKQRMNRKNALHVLAAKRSHVNKLFMSPNLHKSKRMSLDFDADLTPDGSPSKQFDSPADYFQFSAIERRLYEKQEHRMKKSADLEKAGKLSSSKGGSSDLYSTSLSVRAILNRAKESLVTLSRSGGANMSLYRVKYNEYLYTQDTINLMFKFRRFYHRTVYLPRLYKVREMTHGQLVSKMFAVWKVQHQQRCKKETALEPIIQQTHSRIYQLKVKHAFKRLYRNVYDSKMVREHLQLFADRIRSNPVYLEAAYRMWNLKYVQCFAVLKRNYETKGLTTATKLRCDRHRHDYRLRSGFRRFRKWCAALSAQRLQSNGNKHSKYILLSLFHRRHPRNSRSVYGSMPRSRHANHKAVVNPSLRDIPDISTMHITSPLTTVAVEMMLMARALKRLRRWSKLTKVYFSLAEMKFGQGLSSLLRDVNNPQSKERERWIRLANRMSTRLLSASNHMQHQIDPDGPQTPLKEAIELSGGASSLNGLERSYKLVCLHPETQRLVLCSASNDVVHRGGGRRTASSASAAKAFDQNVRSPFSSSGPVSRALDTEAHLSISKVGKVLMRYYDSSLSSRPSSTNSLVDTTAVGGVASLIPRDPHAPKPVVGTVLMVKALRRWMQHCTKYHRLREIREKVRAIAYRRISRHTWTVWRSVYSMQRVFINHRRKKHFYRIQTYALKRIKGRDDMIRSKRAYLGKFLRRWTEVLPARDRYKRLHAGHVYNTIMEILDDSDTSAAAVKRSANNKIRKALLYMTTSADVNFHLRTFLMHHPKERFPSHTDQGSEIAKQFGEENETAVREAAAAATAAPNLMRSTGSSSGLFSRVKAMKQERVTQASGVPAPRHQSLAAEAADRQQYSFKCSVGYLTHCLFDGIVLYKKKHYFFQRLKRRVYIGRRLKELIRGTEIVKMEFALNELRYNKNIRKKVKQVRKLRTRRLFKMWKSTLVFEKARHFILRNCLHFLNSSYRHAVQSRVWYRVWGQKMRYAWTKWQQFTTHYRVITEKAANVAANLMVVNCFKFMKVAVKTGRCWRARSKARALQYFAYLYNEKMADRVSKLLLASYRLFHTYVDFKSSIKRSLKQKQNLVLADSFYLMRSLANGFSALCLQVMKKHNPQKEGRKLLAMIDKRYLKKILSAVYNYRMRLSTWYTNGLIKQPRLIFDVRQFDRILEHKQLVDGHYLPIEVKAVERLRRIYPESYNQQKMSDKDQRILSAMTSSANLKSLGRRRSDASVLSISPVKSSTLSMKSPSFMFSQLPSDPRASFYSRPASIASMTPTRGGGSMYGTPGPPEYQRSFVEATPQPRSSYPAATAGNQSYYNRSNYNNQNYWDDGSIPTLNTLPSPIGAANDFQANIPNSIETFTPTRGSTVQHRTAQSTKSMGNKSRAASRKSARSEGIDSIDEEYADDFEGEDEEVEDVVPYTDDMDISPGAEMSRPKSMARVPSRAASVKTAASAKSLRPSPMGRSSAANVSGLASISSDSNDETHDNPQDAIEGEVEEEELLDEDAEDGVMVDGNGSAYTRQSSKKSYFTVDTHRTLGDTYEDEVQAVRGLESQSTRSTPTSYKSGKSILSMAPGGLPDAQLMEDGGALTPVLTNQRSSRSMGNVLASSLRSNHSTISMYPDSPLSNYASVRSMTGNRLSESTDAPLRSSRSSKSMGNVLAASMNSNNHEASSHTLMTRNRSTHEMSSRSLVNSRLSRVNSVYASTVAASKTSGGDASFQLSRNKSSHDMSTRSLLDGGVTRANSVYGSALKSEKSTHELASDMATPLSSVRSSHNLSTRSLHEDAMPRANSVYGSALKRGNSSYDATSGLSSNMSSNRSSHDMSTRSLTNSRLSRVNSMTSSNSDSHNESAASLVSDDSFIRQVTLKINTDLNSYRGLYNSPSKHQMLDSARSRVSFKERQPSSDEYSPVEPYDEGDLMSDGRSRVSFQERQRSIDQISANGGGGTNENDEDYDAVPYEDDMAAENAVGTPNRQSSQSSLLQKQPSGKNLVAAASQLNNSVASLTPQRSQLLSAPSLQSVSTPTLMQQKSQRNLVDQSSDIAPTLTPQKSQRGLSRSSSFAPSLTRERSQRVVVAPPPPSEQLNDGVPSLMTQKSRPSLISVPSQKSVNASVFSFPTPPASLISVALNKEPAFSQSVSSMGNQTDDPQASVTPKPLQKQKSMIPFLRQPSMSSMNLKEQAELDAKVYRELNLRRCLKKWATASRLKVIPRFFADRHYFKALGIRMLRKFVINVQFRLHQKIVSRRGASSRVLSRMFLVAKQKSEARAIVQFASKYRKVLQLTKAIKRWRTRTIRRQRKNSKLNSADYFYRMRQKALFFLFIRAKSLPPSQSVALAAVKASGGSETGVGGTLTGSDGGRGRKAIRL